MSSRHWFCRYIGLALLVAFFSTGKLHAQLAIGQWCEHFSYNTALKLATGNGKVFAAYKYAVSSYSLSDHSVARYSKANGLSDAAVANIAYSNSQRMLVIAYANSNVDLLLDNGTVLNISDIKRSSLSGDKTIYSITCLGNRAYLSCGFGIVVVDLVRSEIEATYTIGSDSDPYGVHSLAFDDTAFYAATSHGVFVASRSDKFLNIASHWRLNNSSLSGLDVVSLVSSSAGLLALVRDDDISVLFAPIAGDYMPFLSGEIVSVRSYNDNVVVVYSDSVVVYNKSLKPCERYDYFEWGGLSIHDALFYDGILYYAHDWAGLLSLDKDNNFGFLSPSGNVTDNAYKIVANRSRTFVCPGGLLRGGGCAYIRANLYTFASNEWNQLSQSPLLDTLTDLLDVAVDPKDTSHLVAALWDYGLLDIYDNVPAQLFDDKNTNGALHAYTSGSYRSLRTGGVVFDPKGSLWAVNSLAENGLVVRHRNGVWQSFNTANMVNGSELYHILYDSITGYKWFYGAANKIFVHDGVSRMAYVDPNNGSKLETSAVNAVVQDRMGDIWVGTNKGIKVIYNTYKAFNNGGNGECSPLVCSNIVITNGEINEYLMAYENISCIAVDGANRKWVGTQNSGVYLLSDNGSEELLHFTANDSPLPSNQIVSIAVQPVTGEVFILTTNGLVAYRGTATYASLAPNDNVHVFPNPVQPDYDGPIAISGFTSNALVHVVDVSGHVLFTTRANGGQAIWNGRTNAGEHVAAGVYYVFASDNEGTNRSVAKVLVIR